MTAPLVNQIEALGRAVDDGLLGRDEAIALLVEWRAGGLTPLGAARQIDDWKNARIRYTKVYLDARDAIERLGGAL